MKKRLFNIILKPKGIKQEADSKTVVSGWAENDSDDDSDAPNNDDSC
jgi:hypothetical protein